MHACNSWRQRDTLGCTVKITVQNSYNLITDRKHDVYTEWRADELSSERQDRVLARQGVTGMHNYASHITLRTLKAAQ